MGSGGSVGQCSARDLKVASLVLAHGSFLVREVVLSLTLAELYGLLLLSLGGIIKSILIFQ